ncbi:MAG: serine/threonine-protein phosphatase [Lentisphaeria bacterium]|nr:serine/threonine-protein phosphatase [Lentisphaeria bacterium]
MKEQKTVKLSVGSLFELAGFRRSTSRYEIAADSFIGLVRSRNEDSFVYAREIGGNGLLAVVTDGIGSTRNGDIASHYTARLLADAWRREDFSRVRASARPGVMRDFLDRTICRINHQLYQINAISAREGERDSLGTTLTAAVFMDNTLVAVNAGDSPLFRIHDGKIKQLTFDHNLANELLRSGQITTGEFDSVEYGRMLTRYIGPKDEVTPEFYTSEVRPGDYFLLCSDGLTLHVSPEEILRTITARPVVSEALKTMFNTSINRGAMDNITAILVKIL